VQFVKKRVGKQNKSHDNLESVGLNDVFVVFVVFVLVVVKRDD